MDKLAHLLLIVPVAAFGLVLLGYRDRARVDLADQLAALLAMLVGMLVAMLLEWAEFVFDWVLGTQVQPSNTDTMLDLLASYIGAAVGGVLATTIYRNVLTAPRREWLGSLGIWLSDGPSRVLDKHGFAITLAVTGVVALTVAALWFTGRPVPGFGNG
ncbi:MAG TPA: hypothetical protein VGL99_18590 [Chloroflexota bacterium]